MILIGLRNGGINLSFSFESRCVIFALTRSIGSRALQSGAGHFTVPIQIMMRSMTCRLNGKSKHFTDR